MAAYKDDFYYGSDFSDFSENEADLGDISDGNFGSDDEGIPLYCICNLPGTTEMIACDGEGCKIEWFHYECVGFASDTIPTETSPWFCEFCRPNDASAVQVVEDEENMEGADIPSTSSQTQPCKNTTRNPVAAKKTSKKSKAKGAKKGTAKGRDKVKRPAVIFTASDAKKNAVQYLKTGLEMMTTNKVFCGSLPTAVCVITLVTTLLNLVDSPQFTNFSEATVSALWLIVTSGDEKFLKPEGAEVMWRAFHQFKLNSIGNWTEFLKTLSIGTDGQHVLITYQYLLQTVLTLLVKDRHATDSPQTTTDKDDNVNISKEEEQVLRYIAGYVPFSLHNKYKTQKNDTASIFCKILGTWQACTSNTAKSFLDYTNDWIAIQNRGGLFNVNDDVYLFFRTIENESRNFLTRDNLDKFPGVDIKSTLKEKILAKNRVHTYWCTITRSKITGEVSKKLLNNVINLYIKIRIKAFVKVYLDLKKYSGAKTVSKKGEKALRKTLAS